ncbi:MAG: hypothetical protein CMK53_03125 [Proteobacteria bacterium]|nr:hypothetical protein [Pseudomonadota bacterium]MBI12944.1 hypothetical protein [Deltaproteobacteria bacterium]MBP44667.1 hypothetical protein [Deltaproteobacteria bacterium]
MTRNPNEKGWSFFDLNFQTRSEKRLNPQGINTENHSRSHSKSKKIKQSLVFSNVNFLSCPV